MSDRTFKAAVVIIVVAMIIMLAANGMRHDSYVERCETLGGTAFYTTPNASKVVCLSGFQKLKP